MGLRPDRSAPVWALCGAIATWVAIAPRAIADNRVALGWDADEACPSRAWLTTRVERYLDGELTQDAGSELDVRVEVEQRGRRFRAEVTLRSPEGVRERSLRDADCVVVADAVAFIVAQAIDPEVLRSDAPLTDEEVARGRRGGGGTAGDSGGRRADGSEAGSGGGAAGDGDEDASADDEDHDIDDQDEQEEIEEGQGEQFPERPSPPMRIGGAVGVDLALGFQPLPAASPGVVAHGALLLGTSLRAELGLGYYAPQSEALESDADAEARFERVFASAGMCAVAPSSQTDLALCLALQAGLVRGRGVTLSAGTDTTLPDLALSLGPALLHRLGRGWGVRVELAPTFAVVRPRFLVDTGGGAEVALHTAEKIGFFGRVGFEHRFD